MTKLVIFDLDGVLIDTIQTILNSSKEKKCMEI